MKQSLPSKLLTKLRGKFLFCLLVSVSFALAQEPYLKVQLDGSSIVFISLKEQPCWIMRWNHSVTGILVSDYYCFLKGQMLLTDSHTPSFDAGLGHIPDRGTLVSDGFHGYFIFDIDEAVANNEYLLRVGGMRVNHRIEHNGKIYSLSEQAANKRVSVSVSLQ